jgi:hypothetical protein
MYDEEYQSYAEEEAYNDHCQWLAGEQAAAEAEAEEEEKQRELDQAEYEYYQSAPNPHDPFNQQ